MEPRLNTEKSVKSFLTKSGHHTHYLHC